MKLYYSPNQIYKAAKFIFKKNKALDKTKDEYEIRESIQSSIKEHWRWLKQRGD